MNLKDHFKNCDIRGLFQTDNKVGLIFPIMMVKGIPTFNWGTPTFNDCRGENLALSLMEQKDFVCWAVDPWDGTINMKIVYNE